MVPREPPRWRKCPPGATGSRDSRPRPPPVRRVRSPIQGHDLPFRCTALAMHHYAACAVLVAPASNPSRPCLPVCPFSPLATTRPTDFRSISPYCSPSKAHKASCDGRAGLVRKRNPSLFPLASRRPTVWHQCTTIAHQCQRLRRLVRGRRFIFHQIAGGIYAERLAAD